MERTKELHIEDNHDDGTSLRNRDASEGQRPHSEGVPASSMQPSTIEHEDDHDLPNADTAPGLALPPSLDARNGFQAPFAEHSVHNGHDDHGVRDVLGWNFWKFARSVALLVIVVPWCFVGSLLQAECYSLYIRGESRQEPQLPMWDLVLHHRWSLLPPTIFTLWCAVLYALVELRNPQWI